MSKFNHLYSPFSIVEAVNRKVCISKNALSDYYYYAAKSYCNSLKSQIFRGIVFDYDLTLHNKHQFTETEEDLFTILNMCLANNIQVGIATGNGEYIAKDIRSKIHQTYWGNVIMGYYNGGFIIPLDCNITFSNVHTEIPGDFEKTIMFLSNSIPKGKICADGIEQKNPFQLNFYSDEDDGEFYIGLLQEFILGHTDLKILHSPHSFDVVPPWISKLNVCSYMCSIGLAPQEIITIGDSGHVGGNDYELLNWIYSLSVNSVSDSPNNCWNFSPQNIQDLDATLFYLQRLRYNGNGSFTFDI